mmetsp:Transcript_1287/g.3684  ORF Transcript_1287/g.3684 Transcript_1287/m.3684 type:complete len:200 (+) Transcript_1287:2700-3299(+)
MLHAVVAVVRARPCLAVVVAVIAGCVRPCPQVVVAVTLVAGVVGIALVRIRAIAARAKACGQAWCRRSVVPLQTELNQARRIGCHIGNTLPLKVGEFSGGFLHVCTTVPLLVNRGDFTLVLTFIGVVLIWSESKPVALEDVVSLAVARRPRWQRTPRRNRRGCRWQGTLTWPLRSAGRPLTSDWRMQLSCWTRGVRAAA